MKEEERDDGRVQSIKRFLLVCVAVGLLAGAWSFQLSSEILLMSSVLLRGTVRLLLAAAGAVTASFLFFVLFVAIDIMSRTRRRITENVEENLEGQVEASKDGV